MTFTKVQIKANKAYSFCNIMVVVIVTVAFNPLPAVDSWHLSNDHRTSTARPLCLICCSTS